MLLTTIAVPLILGLLVAAIGAGRVKLWQALGFGVAVFAVYVLLEGMPALPPVSAKHKLGLMIPLAVALAYLPGARARWAVPGFLLLALIWLGWAKISQGAVGVSSLALLLPVVISAVSQPSEEAAEFLWPAALIVFGIGAAILSLLGVFVGFAQAMGGLTALLGGAAAVAYVRLLLGFAGPTLSVATLRLALMVSGAVALMIGLFAPHINHLAFAVLALVWAVPAVAPATRLPAALQPFAFGLMAAVPAALSVLIAWGFPA